MVASPPMSRVWRGAALFFGAAPLLFAPRVHAESAVGAEQPLRIQYEVHQGCPDALSFFWHVRARTQRVRLAQPGELAVLASVHIAQEAGQSVGTLALPDAAGQPFTRRVEASSCNEVVLALSLVLALAYDPDAMATFPAPSAPSTPSAPEPALAPHPAEPPAAPPELAPPPAPRPAEPALRAAVGAEALLMSSVAPGLRSAFGPFIEFGAASDSLWWRPRVVATLLVEAPEANVSVSAAGAQRSATLSYAGGRLAGCPGSWALASGLELGPCVGLTVGRISGSGGSGLTPPSNGSDWWAAAELMGALRYAMAGPVFLQALGGAGISLYRPTFALHTGAGSTREDVPFHQVRAGFGEFGIALGVHFP